MLASIRLVVLLSIMLSGGLAADTVATPVETGVDAETEAGAEEERERTLPLLREWFEDQDIPRPLPLGAGLMRFFMERDIEVRDATVQFLDRPPESISVRADFEVSNHTRSLVAPVFGRMRACQC